jgi:hypothetical protein
MKEEQYPLFPGFKAQETSRQAAIDIAPEARGLQQDCLRALENCPRTADEVAEYLSKSILAIRPRMAELFRMGKIEDTMQRHKNASGKWAIVWRLKNVLDTSGASLETFDA